MGKRRAERGNVDPAPLFSFGGEFDISLEQAQYGANVEIDLE